MTAIRRRPRLNDFGHVYRLDDLLTRPLYVGEPPRPETPWSETHWAETVRIALFTACCIGAAVVFFGGLRLP